MGFADRGRPSSSSPAAGGTTLSSEPTRTGTAGVQQQVEALAATSAARAAPEGLLPTVLSDTPAAVLLINRVDGLVTYANRAAIDLAGDVGLPIGVDAWGAAAGLTDLAGEPLAGTDAPLSRVAGGHPVAGEPVRLQPRRSDDVGRAGAATDDDEQLLWVTGFPLRSEGEARPARGLTYDDVDGADTAGPEAPRDHHADLSLVVFLPVSEGQLLGDRAGADSLQLLREQAIVATDVCFTISDPYQEDNPLVWVNPAFTRVTGYSLAESLGHNCRFLQGPKTDPAAVAAIREAVEDQLPTRVTLLNYRADGSPFWNQLSLTPVFDGSGRLVSFVGVQSDVTARVSVERERKAALSAERSARETSQAAGRRLELMARAVQTLTGTLDTDELMTRLARLCVPSLADCVFVGRLDDGRTLASAVLQHGQLSDSELDGFVGLLLGQPLAARSPAADAVRTGRRVVLDDVRSPGALARYPDLDVHRLADRLEVTSLAAFPLRARGTTLGVLVLTSAEADAFSEPAVELLADLASRASLALDNARLYQGQRSVAQTLQRVLLAELPQLPDVEVAAHYESASTAAAVGGDFYDLLALPDGSVGISIGDVVGHDIHAAATMGQLRTLLRTTAYDSARPDPADVIDRVDELMEALSVPGLATLAHAHAHRPEGGTGSWRLEIANAGHPPLAVRTPDGAVRFVTESRGLLLGVGVPTVRETTTVLLPRGSLVVAYTDGLVERRDQDLDQGLARLGAALAAQPVDAGVEDVCSALLPLAGAQNDDDVALMVLRLT